jgi:AcrR family transcriptional regulator
MQAEVRKSYVSRLRAERASGTRVRILAASEAVLETEPYEPFSLDAVARRAGVTRLTVYHQFGGRRGLLEALFDALAARAGMTSLADAVAAADPEASVPLVVTAFCRYWGSARRALKRLYGAMAADPDLAQGLGERNERRRRLFTAIARRLDEQRGIGETQMNELVDVLFTLTSFHVFDQLSEGRDGATTRAVIQRLADDALARTTRFEET